MSNNQSATATKHYNFCTSTKSGITEKFVWTIENFSEQKYKERKCSRECLESTEFISATPNNQLLKWRMLLFGQPRDDISLHFSPINSTNEDVGMKAKYQFSIRKPNGSEFKFNICELNYRGLGCWCSDNKPMMKWEDLFNEGNGYIYGGQITIECTLMIFQQKSIKFKLPDEVPECRIIQEDLGHLYEKSLFWDCKIISVDGKEFKTHKCILGCRSPVFEAMFQHKMTENTDNIIDIVDIKGEVIDQMLRFIYSGKEPNFGEIVEDLLFAADKYEINRLKLLCEHKLIYSLGSENACELFSLADLYSAEQLKAHTIGFIKMHLNEVMESEGWKTLADEKLKGQILEAIAK